MNSKPDLNELSQIESAVRELKLSEPSLLLDRAISNLAQGGADIPAPSERSPSPAFHSSGFGWATMALTTLVATLFGILVGYRLAPSIDNVRLGLAPASSESNMPTDVDRKMTPVSFNVAAFDLLHGHSDNEHFSDCKKCHVGDIAQEKEAFPGWFYGDQEFFRHHDWVKLAKCQDCHVVEKPKTFPKPIPHGLQHKDVAAINCSKCHVGSERARQPSRG